MTTPPDIRIRLAAPGDMGAVRRLCWAYRDALVARNRDTCPDLVEMYYARATFEDLLAQLPALHSRPDGAIYVGTLKGKVVACGMTRRIDAETCEIKRVFVDDAARGFGLAKRLCTTAMEIEAAHGYSRMVLDTMVTLTEAIALYEALGFTPCDPFWQPAPEFAKHIQFYARAI